MMADSIEEVVTSVDWRIEPSGDRLLIVDFNPERDADSVARSNRSACAAAKRLRTANIVGVTDIVPALTTVGIHYQPASVVRGAKEAPFHAMLETISALLAAPLDVSTTAQRLVEVPVCYGGEHGPDLVEVASICGMTPAEVIERHSAAPVDVLMLGFAPGHPYVGTFDARLSPPRRSTPRTSVPAGSIGLANRQSVIYPMDLPGGWNLIGRTPLGMFDPHRQSPCLLGAGDQIRFVPISAEKFDAIAKQESQQ